MVETKEVQVVVDTQEVVIPVETEEIVVPIEAIGTKGEKGDKGDTALSITIGTTTTGEAGTDASVTNSGTNTDLVLNFTIPKGAKGDKGTKGDKGEQGIQGIQGVQGEKGDKGDTGEGVPTGGTTGQVLKKKSNTNYDTEWSDESTGITSGSNDNGNWIKYADGTMICYINKLMSDFTYNNLTIVYSADCTFPANFIEIPCVIATAHAPVSYDVTVKASSIEKSSVNVKYYAFNPTSKAYESDCTNGSINIVAIGKWK